MSKELIDRLKSYIPSGDGHNSQYANDLADAVAILEAKAVPVGERLVVTVVDPDCRTTTEHVITERDVILLWNRIDTLERQQAWEVVMPDAEGSAVQKSFWTGFEAATLRLFGTNIRAAWNSYKASDEFARLNKGAGSHE